MHRKEPSLRVPLLLALMIGLCLLAAGIGELFSCELEQSHYRALIPGSLDDTAGDAATSEAGRGLPPGAVGWIQVEGVDINLPVADGSRGNEWYLNHDLWGNKSALGCLFMDSRCSSPEGTHVIIYGHHFALTNYMFSPLHSCYRQPEFSRLRLCHWATQTCSYTLKPLCALSVDKDYAGILRFTFSSTAEFHEWLASMVEVSSAHAEDAATLVRNSNRTLTLVTCTSNTTGQPWRTLVLFVC